METGRHCRSCYVWLGYFLVGKGERKKTGLQVHHCNRPPNLTILTIIKILCQSPIVASQYKFKYFED